MRREGGGIGDYGGGEKGGRKWEGGITDAFKGSAINITLLCTFVNLIPIFNAPHKSIKLLHKF